MNDAAAHAFDPVPLEITFLGTGTSHGVPMIGCDCIVCRSADPRDKRNRTAITVQLTAGGKTQGRVILIDVPPEFRLSAIAYQIARVDAVLITHAHADHIMGMDDLRRYNNLLGQTLPVHGSAETVQIIRRSFGYAEGPYTNPDRPSLSLHVLEAPTEVCGAAVTPIPLIHGRVRNTGYRIGGFAYCTDCSSIPEETYPLLTGLDLLVIDALRYTPHPAHFNLEQSLAAIERIGPRRAVLTHIAHEMLHARLERELPDNVSVAADGLRVRV